MREVLLKLIEEKSNIPPLPDILSRLESKIEDPKSNISDIAILIETEPILAGRLIKLSNSVFFGGGREKVEHLHGAILRLGLKMILDLAYTLEMPQMFLKGNTLDQNKFWQHSLAVAILARQLSHRIEHFYTEPDLCYLAGLMHDIGILVFNYLVPQKYASFLKEAQGRDHPLEEMEMKAFGIAHPEMGGLFIKKWWPVPEQVASSVEKHYLRPSNKTKDHPVLLIVILANSIANNYQTGHEISSYTEPVNSKFLEEVGISKSALEDIVEETRESLFTAKEVLYK